MTVVKRVRTVAVGAAAALLATTASACSNATTAATSSSSPVTAASSAGSATAAGSASPGASAAGGATPTAGAMAAGSSRPLKTLLFVNPLPNYPAWKTIGACMKQEAQKNGISFSQSGPNGNNVDTKLMVDRLQQGIADKTNALVTFPISAQQFDPVFQQARTAGLYVATLEGGQTKNQNLNAGTSFTEFGQLAAKTVAAKPGKQVVAFLTEGPTGPAAIFVDAFKKAAAQYPNITIASTRYDGGDLTKTVDLATAMMTANPAINHFVTNEGGDTPGIIAAIKQKNAVGRVFLTTNSIYSGSVQGMADGIVYSFLLQNMCDIGKQPVDALVKLSKGQPVSANIPTQIAFATKSTVKQLTASGNLQ